MTKSAIEKEPCGKKLKKSKLGKRSRPIVVEDECKICYESTENATFFTMTLCKCVYHTDCITEYFKT